MDPVLETVKRAPLRAVDVVDIPAYPIGRDERLDGNSFVKWNVDRWLGSRTFKLMGWAEQGMARALFDMCQKESPVGTLPDDDEELAVMLRVQPREISRLRDMPFGPLRGWSRCICEGEVRLMHRVVTEVVQDALQRRAMHELSKQEKAVAMRLDRLRKALLAEGLDKAVVADDVLVGRIDEWIGAKRRVVSVYRSAILHAVQAGWFGREGVPAR